MVVTPCQALLSCCDLWLQVVLDTVVQRVGDASAAAAFGALRARGILRPSAFPAACVPLCMAWAALAVTLGQRQQWLQLAAAAQRTVSPEHLFHIV